MTSDESNWVIVPTGKRGFAGMTPEKRREIAIKGGKSVPPEKRAFSQNKALAAKAGSKGGKVARPMKRSFSLDTALASRAGKIGGAKSRKPK